MININQYIIEKLKLNKDLKVSNIEERISKLKKITSVALGEQDWHNGKDYYTTVIRGNVFAIRFKDILASYIAERAWEYLFNEYKGKDLIEEENPRKYTIVNNTLYFNIKKDE